MARHDGCERGNEGCNAAASSARPSRLVPEAVAGAPPPSPVPGVLARIGETFAPGASGETRRLCIDGAVVYFGGGRFEDPRGYYEEIELQGSEGPRVLQSGHAASQRNVMRGFHCSPYGKIVVCLAGEMWDVLVDFRPNSPTYLKWDSVILSPERRTRVYVPPGVGHGYLSLKDGTVTLYLKLGCYDKDREIEVNTLDPELAIPWPRPLDGAADYIISAKDRALPGFKAALASRAPASKL